MMVLSGMLSKTPSKTGRLQECIKLHNAKGRA